MLQGDLEIPLSKVEICWEHKQEFQFSLHYIGVILMEFKQLCKICSLEISWGLREIYN